MTWRWGSHSHLGEGSEAGSPEEGAELAGWRNSRKTSVSEESEQGMWRDLVSEQWPGDWNWHGSLGWSRAEARCGLISNLRDFSDGHWRGDRRSNSRS